MAKKKDYDWRKDWDWTDPEDGPASWDDVEVKEIEIDLDKFLLPKEYAYGGGVGHLLEPTQTYHQYHDFTAPMTVGAMVDNMYNRGGRVNYQSGGWNPGAGRDKKGYQTTSPHHSSRDDGPPSITNPYVPPVVKKPPVQVSNSDINPMFQHLITPAAAVKTDFLKKHGWYNNPFTFKGSPLMKAGAEAGGYGLDYDKLIGGDLTVGEVLEGMSGGTYDTFDPNVQKTLGEQILGNVDFGKTFQKDIVGPYNPVIDPTIKEGQIDIDVGKGDLVDEKAEKFLDLKEGGRVGMFMGGDPLTGQALSIYESMNSYGFSDAEIASALQQQGLYTPPDSSTPTPDPTPTPTPTPTPGQGGGDGGGIMELQKTYSTLPGDPKNFRLSQLEGEADYFPPTTGIGKAKNWFQEKFFQPKVKGTLGTRLANRPRLPLPASMMGWARSPFNPTSPTYNAALPMQLNFLEGMTGSKLSGNWKHATKFDEFGKPIEFGIIEGQSMIGRDPNTGALKYGPGSVLEGKNVISGFGSNDYETALNKYISRMLRYENPTKFQAAKLQKARDELAALKAKTKQQYIDSGTQAEVQALQNKINQQEDKINQAAAKKDSKSGASTVNPMSNYGKSQGYTGGNPNPHTSTGWSGSTKSSKSSKSSSKGNNPWGRKDGGSVGVASMFTRRR